MPFNLYTLFLLITSTSLSFGGTLMNRNDLPLSSKVIFQSPMMENVYKDIILSSKPINLKKYATAKPKNSQKDSKIYFIPIGPMPYHFTPGAGYDYQMNPILKGNNQPVPPMNPILNGPNVPPNFLQAFLQTFQQNPQNFLQKLPQNFQQNNQQNVPQNYQPNYIPNITPHRGQIIPQNNQQNVPQNYQPNYVPNITPNRAQIVPQQNVPQNAVAPNSQIALAPAPVGLPNTKMTRLNGHSYYFNGRPFRLQAYRAAPKLNVDKFNLQSHLFFNKNIIY